VHVQAGNNQNNKFRIKNKTHRNNAQHNSTIHAFTQGKLISMQCRNISVVGNGNKMSGRHQLEYEC
jgi:hypothetical protein